MPGVVLPTSKFSKKLKHGKYFFSSTSKSMLFLHHQNFVILFLTGSYSLEVDERL